jgi:hypothetical protein
VMKKSFMKLVTCAIFIKLFQGNLCCYWCIPLSLDSGYATWSVDCDEKSFMKLVTGVNFIKLFLP